jgi:hypothetical protein
VAHPGQQGGAAGGQEDHPGRELVGRAHDDRPHLGIDLEIADPQPLGVDQVGTIRSPATAAA